MNLPDVSAWLASDRDFKQGVALYAALGTNTTYQRLFTLGESDYSRAVLLRELQGLAGPVPAPTPAAPTPEPPAAPTPEPPAAPVPAAEPPGPTSTLLTDLFTQLQAVRDERSQTHPQLTGLGVGQKRRQKLAGRIVALTTQETTLKAHVAHVQQHGRLPGPVATAEVSDPVELKRRLLTLRTRRSKLKHQPEKADKLAAIEAEITLIQSKCLL